MARLVVYNLDVEQVQQAVDKKELTGRSARCRKRKAKAC
jgi:hypothetical protein